MAKIYTVNGVQYREVDRKAEVGDNIYIKKAFGTGGFYNVGDVLTIKRTDGDRLFVNENPRPIHVSEYVVLEPVADADIIVHNGKQYRKVDRPVRKGDELLILTDEDLYLTVGKVYAINGIDSDGEPEVTDDVGDSSYASEGCYAILEPVEAATASLSALETELAATRAKVAEMEAQLAEVKRKEAESQRLKVGEYGVITKNPGNMSIGDVVEIIASPYYGYKEWAFNAKRMSDGRVEQFESDEIRRATDEEVAEAKRKLARPKIGDYVRVTKKRGGHFASVGELLRVWDIVTYGKNHIRCEKLDGSRKQNDYFYDDEIEKVAEETAKWAAIGRKVGEFRKGDIVRVIKTGTSAHQIGDIGVVGEFSQRTSEFRVNGRITNVNWLYPSYAELIAPVESVVNLRGGDAA